MARGVHEGNTQVRFLPACANIAAPTVAEIAAGTNLTNFITKDGLTTPSNQNFADAAGLDETFDSQRVGSFGGPVQTTCFRDRVAANDTAWNLITRGLTGFLVIGRGTLAVGTGAKVEVYPVEAHEPVMMQTATNEMQKFSAQWAVTSQPNLKATVA